MIINGDYFRDADIESFSYVNGDKSTLVMKSGARWSVPVTYADFIEVVKSLEEREHE